ncbi:type II/IV secretion system protein [Candidatus Parcubacteria bacterium]|nr:type II/IV secretion system protein [Candidatus Parcubacteria bacterium]
MAIIKELVKRGILDKTKASELEIEAKRIGKKEEEILIEKNIIEEEKLFLIKSDYLKIPLRKVELEEIVPEVLEIVPEETAKFYYFVALAKAERTLHVGMVWPEDLEAVEALKFLTRKLNLEPKIYLITLSDFQKVVKRYRRVEKEVKEVVTEVEKEITLDLEKEASTALPAMERLAEEAPISKTVAVILRYGIEGGATDIHIEPLEGKTRVRFRILGTLFSTLNFPKTIHSGLVARIKILSNLRLDESRLPQDGRFSINFEGRKIDFRVSTFPTAYGEKVALRILDPKIGLKKLEELGLSPRNYKIVQRALEKPFGMILVCGPTGSGKTTTIYALLQKLNKEETNIVTLEDPVEYLIPGINQAQIRPEISFDFAKGLRHVLRQDPDIIMVGEIRDSETAFLATHAALTGHIVLSTLHTNNAPGAIPRLIDLGVPRFLIPPTLSLVVAQRLVKTLCPHCKKPVKAGSEIEKIIREEVESLPKDVKEKVELGKPLYIFEAKGCKECQGKGFVGRIALFEMLEMTPELGEIILKEPTESKILEESKKQGMLTLRQDGILKVLEGTTTIGEVMKETTKTIG